MTAPATETQSPCGCDSTGLKRPPAWQGLTLASVLPDIVPADAAPEPEAPQGEYSNAPDASSAPLSIPLRNGAENSAHAVELLAPAGGLDAAYAGFHYGADAVYLGLQKFSARAEAENFTLDDVDAITSFAHAQARPRKVFVTINTVILQHELNEVIDDLGALSEIGVDALIVQDLGVYGIVRKHFPNLELHASTQLAVHNRAGAETLKAMGFSRVVLARELTLEEISDITATSGVETEVFIHGALCYSYSGLCLFSSQTNGRSGNRGKCAYSCRDDFQITHAPETLRDGTPTKRSANRGFAFSMKDLATPDNLPILRAAGVSCVKIEGRKKSPLYVATTTDYYRRLLDGTLPAGERSEHEADMQTVFSRPWTRLFSLSHKDKEVADRDTVGHRGTRVGTVEEILNPNSAQPFVRLRTSRPIERHDGLQIEVPSLGKPFGFAVETLRLIDESPSRRARGNETVFEAPAGALIEVALPEEHPFIPLGAPIFCSSSQSVKRRYRHERPKAGSFRTRQMMDVELTLTAREVHARAIVRPRTSANEEVVAEATLAGPFEPAKSAEKMAAAARGAFEKLGETVLNLGRFELRNPQSLFVPVSRLNELRRDLCERLEQLLAARHHRRIDAVKSAFAPKQNAKSTSPERWSIKVDRIDFLDRFDEAELARLDEIVLDIARDQTTLLMDRLAQLERSLGRERIRLALPPVTRKWEENGIQLKLAKLRAAGYTRWEAGNVSAWSYLNLVEPAGFKHDLDLATDWSVYVVNRAAALQVIEMGATRFALSPEDGLENMTSLLREFGAQATVIVHQDTPMFMAESCAYANLIGGCPGKANCRFESMDMVSSYGEKVQAIDYHCRTIVLNKGAFCLSPRLDELRHAGARSFRVDLIYRKYDPDEALAAWRTIRRGENVVNGHAANFDRGML